MSRVETCGPDPERVDLLLGGSGSETRKGCVEHPAGWMGSVGRSEREATYPCRHATDPTIRPSPASGLRIARHYSSEAQAYRDLWAPVLVGLARWLVEELPHGDPAGSGSGLWGGALLHLDRGGTEGTGRWPGSSRGDGGPGSRDFPLLVGGAAELPFAAGSLTRW